MSGDEIFALIVSIVIGMMGWQGWLGGLFFVRSLRRRPGAQSPAVAGPLLGGFATLLVLMFWSAQDVRSDATYIAFYFALWFGWLGAAQLALAGLGFSLRDDVFERENLAAALGLGGALTGLSLAFAGGNIGDGPGWWVVLFSGGLGSVTLLGLWLFGNLFTGVGETITVDRDVAAGWRMGGFFIGGGLIVGRAAAGNWHSAGATIGEFLVLGWPVLGLAAAAFWFDWIWRPTPHHPRPAPGACGFLPALGLLLAGLGVVLWQGKWQ